jgi:hypothetical protein
MELFEGWFNPESIDKTMHSLIKCCDKDWLRSVDKDAFVEGLINEIVHLSVYNHSERMVAANYVRRWSSYFYAQAQNAVKET